jgi:hypothetical protein
MSRTITTRFQGIRRSRCDAVPQLAASLQQAQKSMTGQHEYRNS